jgi:DnaK suppressor protein
MEQQANNERSQALRKALTRERSYELERVRQFRRDQEQDGAEGPGDELDVARSDLDTELHVSLIGISEERLKAIDDAFGRLERGVYGICATCGDEISTERLKVLPFSIYCVDCQHKRETERGPGRIIKEYATRWTVPQDLAEALEPQGTPTLPEEEIPVAVESSFGPEEGELEQMPPTTTVRRRGRPRNRKTSSD